MFSSPRSPTHRRDSDEIDSTSIALARPQSNDLASPVSRASLQRRSFVTPPSTPPTAASRDRSSSFSVGNGFSGDMGQENGLGNLADELAEAWAEEQKDELNDEGLENGISGLSHLYDDSPARLHHGPKPRARQDCRTSPSSPEAHNRLSLSPQHQSTRLHRHRENAPYDGSESSNDSDGDISTGILPSLEARMAAIESLARRGTECNGSDTDTVVNQVANSLRDLEPQSNLENSTTRLITTYTALISHLSHQTRLLQTLSRPLVSPFCAPPDPSIVETLLPLVSSLLLALPAPESKPLRSLFNLHSSTADLLATLSALSDTLYMTRQTALLASRRLKAARETVEELKREEALRAEGMRWVEKGGWQERLQARECAKVCGEVVGGFEEVCNGWRERLLIGEFGVEIGAG